VLTRSGWAVLVAGVLLGVAALGLRLSALAVLALGCVLALGASALSMLLRPQLQLVRLLIESRVTVGESASVELIVTNTHSRPSAATVAHERIGSTTVTVPIPAVAPRGERTVHYELPGERRGMFPLAPLVVTRADPLGLTRLAALESAAELTLWVHPRTQSVSPLPSGRRLAEDGPTGADARQGGLVFQSLREYVVGDDVRHIHWRATAHAGELMVRENLETTVPAGVVVLDTRRAVHTEQSFEDAIEVAASLLVASLHAQVPMLLATTGGSSIHPEGAADVLDQLAALEMDEGLDIGGFDAIAPVWSRGGSLVLVTGSPLVDDTEPVATLCRRFADATLVQFGSRGGGDLSRVVPTLLRVDSPAAFAAIWNQAHG
jgi:uncharacterized protein (DUF58 family)